MALTLAHYVMHVKNALGSVALTSTELPGPVGPTGDQVETHLVNQAGMHMFTHPWNFRLSVPTTLDFAEDTAYVELPAAFDELVAYMFSDGTQYLNETTLQEIILRRGATVSPWGRYWFAISQPHTGTSLAFDRPRMELYPTPAAATTTGAMTIIYRRSWATLDAAAEYPAIPTWAESLLIEYCRAFADSYHHEDFSTNANKLNDNISNIEDGPVFKRVLDKDGQLEADIGRHKGGMVYSRFSSGNAQWVNTIANPS